MFMFMFLFVFSSSTSLFIFRFFDRAGINCVLTFIRLNEILAQQLLGGSKRKSNLKRNPGTFSIRTYYTRNENQPMRRNYQGVGHSSMNWDRDYNALRAILSKVLKLVAGRQLPHNYLRTNKNVPERQRFARVR